MAQLLAGFLMLLAVPVQAGTVEDDLIEACTEVPEDNAAFFENFYQAGWSLIDETHSMDAAKIIVEQEVLLGLPALPEPPLPSQETQASFEAAIAREAARLTEVIEREGTGGLRPEFFSLPERPDWVLKVIFTNNEILGDKAGNPMIMPNRPFIHCTLVGSTLPKRDSALSEMVESERPDSPIQVWSDPARPQNGAGYIGSYTHDVVLELQQYDPGFYEPILGRPMRAAFALNIQALETE